MQRRWAQSPLPAESRHTPGRNSTTWSSRCSAPTVALSAWQSPRRHGRVRDAAVLKGLDELRAVVGTFIGHSNWHEVTQARVDQFADATGDRQWIHTDVELVSLTP